jgi:hypothetical protein
MPETLDTVNDADTRARLTKPAVRAFFRLTGTWRLTEAQQLALLGESISRSTLNTWETAGPRGVLSVDQLARISYLLGIYEGLQRFFRRAPREGDRWVRRPRAESPFLGASPLDFMIRGGIPAMDAVRRYVDAAAGGPPSRSWYPAPSREG